MKRYGWIIGAFVIAAMLVAAEAAVISKAADDTVKEKVVFARVKIEKNTVIENDMLEIREISAEAVHPEALRDVGAAVSKIACQDIEAGEMLLGVRLSTGSRGIIEARDKSKRLFTVEFKNDQANGWQLADGQYVDIIFVPHDDEAKAAAVAPAAKAGASAATPPAAAAATRAVSAPAQAAGSGATSTIAPAPGPSAEPDAAPAAAADLPGYAPANYPLTSPAVPPDYVKVLENIRIAGIIDENGKLADASDQKTAPRYISFEVTGEQAAFLAYAKTNGQLELSSVPE